MFNQIVAAVRNGKIDGVVWSSSWKFESMPSSLLLSETRLLIRHLSEQP